MICRLEPLQDRLAASAPALRAAWRSLLMLMVLVAGVGLLLVLLGNAWPKSRPGFFVGMRTLWAIMDTDNWIATSAWRAS